jgi:hypothetical protein
MLGERAAKGILAAASKSQLFTISHNISEVHVVPFIFNNKTLLAKFLDYTLMRPLIYLIEEKYEAKHLQVSQSD